MKKVMIVSRSPDVAKPDFEGHAYYEYFYDYLSDGFDLVVLSSVYDEPHEEDGIMYYPWSFENKIQGFKGLFRAIRDVKPDILFAEYCTLKTVAAFSIGKIYGASTLMRMAGMPSYEYKLFLSSILSDKKVAITDAVGKRIYGDYELIHAGTDFPEEYETRPSSDLDTITYLGRFSHEKGTDRLVELAEKVLPSEEFEFRVAGWGNFQKKKMEQLDNIYKNFNLVGKIPHSEVFRFLSRSDVLFFPSRKEGMGRSVIESLYVGTPTIVWDLPALREIVKDKNLIIGSLEEAQKVIINRTYENDLNWFDHKEFTVEREMKKIKEILDDL